MQPRTVGLDIYRDFPVSDSQPQLAQQLAAEHLITVCKASDENSPGIAPPPTAAETQIGFSDFVVDADQVLRRHLLALTPDPSSPCRAPYGFSTLLALHYLAADGIPIQATSAGNLQIGDVVFKPIEADFGGYQGVNADGHQMMLNYRSLPNPERIAEQVTLSDVLEDRVDPAAIRDRLVLIGTTAPSFGDIWQVPNALSQSNEGELAGVFTQAHMTSQILSSVLDARPLIKSWSQGLEVLWITFWVALGGGIARVVSRGASARSLVVQGVIAVGLAELTLFVVSWQLLVRWGYWVPWVPAAVVLPIIVGLAVALSAHSVHSA
jgi:CHASE2 domain-containing sensor protein